MAAKRSKRGNPHPLIVEPYPTDYNGYPFITLIQYRETRSLTIVDNTDDKTVSAYVLDLCEPANINEEALIVIADEWFQEGQHDLVPISIAFSRKGVSSEAQKIYRTFNIEFITRVIGPLPKFEMDSVRSVKRRRRKPAPRGVEVVRNKQVKLS